MKGKSTNKSSKATGDKNYLKTVGMSCVWGALTIALVFLLVSFVSLLIDLPASVTSFMAMAAGVMGAFVAGYCCARVNKEKGFAMGLICGLVLFVFMMLANAMMTDNPMTMAALVKFFAMLLASAVGGSVGVNKTVKRK